MLPKGCFTGQSYIKFFTDDYFHSFVLDRGKQYVAGARLPLRLIATAPIGEDGG